MAREEELFRRAAETTNEGIWILDEEWRIIFANHRMAEMIGFPQEKMVGKPVLEFIPEEELPDHLQRIERRKHGLSERYQRRFRRPDGTFLQTLISATPILDEKGKFQGSFAMISDLSEIKKVEEDLFNAIEELRELQFIVNKSPAVVFIWKVELEGHVQFVTENVSQWGYTKEEFESGIIAFPDIIHPDDQERVIEEILRLTEEGRTEFRQYYRILTKDGQVRWVDDITFVKREPSGMVINYQGIVLDVTDRKLAEIKTEEARLRLQAFLEASPDLIYLKDLNGKNVVVNPAYAHYFNKEKEEIEGKTDAEIMPPALAEQCAQSDQEALSSSVPIRAEEKLQNQKGIAIFDTIKFPIKDDRGQAIGLGGISRDITEIQRLAEELRRQKEMLQVTMEHALDIVYRYRLYPEPGFQYVSPSVTRITGYSPEDYYADPLLGIKIVHPEDRTKFEAVINNPASANEPLQLRLIKKDSTVFWTEQLNNPVFDKEGKVVALVGIARDITEQKLAEEKLKETERMLKGFLDALPETAMLLDLEGNVLFANKTASQRIGVPVEELVGTNLFSFYPPGLARRRRAQFLQVIEIGEPFVGEEAIKDRIFLFQVFPLKDEKRKVADLVILSMDITERKKLEDEKDRFRASLIYSVSHELKTPLMVMQAALELLSGFDLAERASRFMEYEQLWKSNLGRLNRLINNMLDSQRVLAVETPIQTRFLDPRVLAKKVISDLESYAQSQGVLVELFAPDSSLLWEIDEEAIGKALENLLSNAIKFSPKGEKVKVKVSLEGEDLVFSVSDNGPGISPEEQNQLFQPFQRAESALKRRVPGTGLGLFVSRRLVEAHGGTLTLESAPGKGTKVLIRLPKRSGH